MNILAANGCFLTAEQGGGVDSRQPDSPVAVTARGKPDEPAANGPWQQWTRETNDDGTISLRCVSGLYLTAENGGGGSLSTDRNVNGPWQRFTPVLVGDTTMLRCSDGIHFLRVRTDLEGPIAAVDATGTLQETFRFPKEPAAIKVTALKRAKLAAFDRDTIDPDNNNAPLPVTVTLTQTVPPRGTLRWWRGNAWGVTIPGLPFVAGAASSPAAQERALTWFLDRWSPEWQDKILRATLERGYDRFTLSWPDSRDGNGQSIKDYVATAKRVKDAGLLPHHMLASKVFDGQNPDPRALDPVIDALLTADVIPLAAAWEMNAFMDPGPAIQGWIKHVADRLVPHGTLMYVHFLPHYAAWQEDKRHPSEFWNPLAGKVTGLLYQCVPTWSVGMMQARLNDVLVRLKAGGLWGLPVDFDVVTWETIAQEQFFDNANEDRGDLVGFQLLCAKGPMPVMGFGNGARMPDGTAL